ncbi:linear amide C-N hydrolase [uncultured Roseobacter sp.]|uniref:linear amide C-N hydrolase n=1 Tax=uncultured Roseobacter sp. TaxID=114847 RepID=UPI00260B963D|nr:linear amide C-N hydrolase [uncultured Roseobacter sp.]
MKIRFLGNPGRQAMQWPMALIGCLVTSAALACSTVALGPDETTLVAYSYDTSATGAGFVVVNPAGAYRTSIMEEGSAQWQSTYGSITFNQLGIGMPTAGMNTAGLAISLMWNDDAEFPPVADRSVVNELEFIQFLLDRAGSVAEAISLIDEVGVQALVPIHYFLADSSGNTAALTPTREGLAIQSGIDMPVRALTNSSYDHLVEGLAGFTGFGGHTPIPPASKAVDPGSLARFAITADAAQSREMVSVGEAFDVLTSVENPQTRWQIVFAPGDQMVHFRLADQTAHHEIDMSAVDFACHSAPLAANLTELSGDRVNLTFQPIEIGPLTDVLGQVLEGFVDATGLSPEIAVPLASAQLGAVSCRF